MGLNSIIMCKESGGRIRGNVSNSCGTNTAPVWQALLHVNPQPD